MITAVLLALSALSQLPLLYVRDFPLRDSIARWLSVNREQNIPSLYSTLTILASALLCAGIAHRRRLQDESDARYWWALSLIFGLLGLDESLAAHEGFIGPLRKLLDIRGGPLWHAWVLPGIAVVAIFVFVFLRFLRRLPRSTRRGLWMAGIVYVSGAIGVEVLGGWYAADHPGIHLSGTTDYLTYLLMVTVEETLEMVGIAILLFTLLAYIQVGLGGARWGVGVVPGDWVQREPARQGEPTE